LNSSREFKLEEIPCVNIVESIKCTKMAWKYILQNNINWLRRFSQKKPIELLLIVRSFTCWGLCKQLSTSQTKDCDQNSKSLGFPMLFVSTTWTISSITYLKKIKRQQIKEQSIYNSYTIHIWSLCTAFTCHIQCIYIYIHYI
jgi:hypothetical protein